MPSHICVAIIVSICLATITGIAQGAEPEQHGSVHWGYEGAEGPEHWGDLSPDFALCGMGTEQSPIDIVQPDAANIPDIVFDYYPSAVNIFNDGHTIQVNYDEASSINVDGINYKLLQFHFHGPSEHTINDKHFAMEMHLVHQPSPSASG